MAGDAGLRFRREAAEVGLDPVGKRMSHEKRDRRRKMLIARDGLACGICGEPMTEATVTIDHIVPVSKGGSHEMANLRLAHKRCNGTRGNDLRSADPSGDQQERREK